MTTRPHLLPRRCSRFGVGKEIGGAVYVHRQYEAKLGVAVSEAKRLLPTDFCYHVVKYNYRSGAISFVQSMDFDIAPEPTVGDILTIDSQRQMRRRRQASDPEIYHHKWLFVADDYDGFDIEESKRRSCAWMWLNGVDRRKIGRKGYWNEHVVPRIEHSDA